MLAFVALAVSIAFWPWWPEPGETARWIAAAFGVTLLLAAAPPPRLRIARWVLVWVAFCFLSAAWSPSPWATAGAAMQALVLAGAFLAGTRWQSGALPLTAFAAGVAVSCLLAVPQAMGWQGLPQAEAPAGLFANRNFLAEAATAALVAAVLLRHWMLAGLLACGLVLAGSKAPAAALLLALAWLLWPHRRGLALLSLALLAAAAAALVLWLPGSLDARLALWGPALENLSAWGHGLGATWAAWPAWGSATVPGIYAAGIAPGHLHNEFLAAASDTGLAALLLVPPLLAAGDRAGAARALDVLARVAPDWPETAALATALEESER